jgi:hypothetical protein
MPLHLPLPTKPAAATDAPRAVEDTLREAEKGAGAPDGDARAEAGAPLRVEAREAAAATAPGALRDVAQPSAAAGEEPGIAPTTAAADAAAEAAAVAPAVAQHGAASAEAAAGEVSRPGAAAAEPAAGGSAAYELVSRSCTRQPCGFT